MSSQVPILAVMAIITTILIMLAIGFFSPAEEKPLLQIEKAINYAEINEGEMVKIELRLKKDFATKAEILDTSTRNIRFECNNSEICNSGKIRVQPRSIFVKQLLNTDAYIRCKKKTSLNDCVVYFGKRPAQLEVTILNFKDSFQRGEETPVLFKIKNIGELEAIENDYLIEIFLIEKNEVRENNILKKEINGVIKNLGLERTETIIEYIEVGSSGEYFLKITAKGEDSGIAFAEQKFSITEGISPNCKATTKDRTYLEENQCKTGYSCEGCETASECYLRWKEKGIEVEIGSKKNAVAYSDSINDSCN